MNVQTGTWVAVVMNADASRGVAADLAGGARTALLGPITVGLTFAALLPLAIGVGLLLWGRPAWAAGPRRPARPGWQPPAPARLPRPSDRRARAGVPRALAGEVVAPHPASAVLAVLWPVLVLTTIASGVAILITGRYPRSLFNFSVGVLRWSWRVGFYGYSALGTDRYPPFTLSRTDYPADFEVDYPERLSRGLVLVKSWLLAIPHLIIVGLLTAPWHWVANGSPTDNYQNNAGISLLGVLVLVAALALLFANRYPRQLFDFVMGINRWVYRVITYVALLRDEYPPFRLDQGAHEPDPSGGSLPPAARDLAGPSASEHATRARPGPPMTTIKSRTRRSRPVLARRPAVIRRPVVVGGIAVNGFAVRALALGALAVSSAALGALAVGALVVGRLKVARADIKELNVTRLSVDEFLLNGQPVARGDLLSAPVRRSMPPTTPTST